MATTEFKVSFWSIEEASEFAEQASLLNEVECFLTEDWTGSDMSNTRGHSPEVHNFFDVEERSLKSFENLISKLQGVRATKDDETIIESIAPKDREQHRQWCKLSEEEYTDKFGTPEDQEEWENSDTLDIWFRKKPMESLFVDS